MEKRTEASSSRRNVVRLLLGLGGLGALGFAVHASRSKVRRRSRSPWLRVHERGDAAPTPRDAPILWLAFATMAPSRRASLLDEVEAAIASVEARANPLLVDFVEDDLPSVFRRNQPWLLPLCTAASALLASSYEAPDGFRVSVLAAEAPRGADDVPAWKAGPEDGRARRARFLAWPASRSVVVRAKSPNGLGRAETELRNAGALPESAIALVVDGSVLYGKGPEQRLEKVFERLASARKSFEPDENLRLFPTAPSQGARVSPWVALDRDELLVVPKLGALSPATRFESELRERLRSGDAELVER